MSNDSVERVCDFCNSEIPKWKAKGNRFCSVSCKFNFKQREKSKRSVASRRNTGSILHSCLVNSLDPAKRCRCRKRITDDKARSLVSKGEVVDFNSRIAEFVEGAPLLLVGRNLKFPRAATIEKAHTERLTQRKAKSKDKSIEELQAAVKQDQLDRFEEEQLRTELYNEITLETRRKWIVEVPADEFDEAERESRGRCIFTTYTDERTSPGIDVDPQTLEVFRPFEESLESLADNVVEAGEQIDSTNDESEEQVLDEDLRTAEQVIAEHREAA